MIILQQIIALLVIVFFLVKLSQQKHRSEITRFEFAIWLMFWLLAGLAVIFIKFIDRISSSLGFRALGIDLMVYMGIALLFYLVMKMRIRINQIDRNITKIVKHLALEEKTRN
jgi:hypothetical protein